ncbi:glycoside hydrolase family 30 protein [Chitinophaga tropicalis]|uniref:Xylanase n=1 Tax=Chitinophaga tropicalis TaxID=2683588 RepID=A0A7K1UD55_9BACT|nr:glycoside hydrolase family 30 protein [Chitinophaga tropicalis]MVT12256.1 xylanase [Chitinophaga tropicalis]
MRRLLVSLVVLQAFLKTAAGQPAAVHIHIDPARTYQTIDNFSASDAWSAQFVGQWPEEKKNAMADWLFSTDTTAAGQPLGIGLSMWRYNVGAGSTEQGDSSGIADIWRRTHSWQNQQGQYWFLRAAQKRNVKKFLAFLNSPPVHLTTNGKAFATKGNCNIGPAKYEQLATYITTAIKGIHDSTGILFSYISPFNEPQWDWSDGNQEGCPYNNEEISALTKIISRKLSAEKLQTKILIGEAGQLDYLYSAAGKPAKGTQIKAFFDKTSPYYIGSLPNLSYNISGHSYFTTSPAAVAVRTREELRKHLATVPGLGFWQSEYCILGDNAGEINGNKRDYGMDAALYLAGVIHRDLTIANAAAWQYWLAISPYNYKDGLIYIDKDTANGQFHDSKMLWALGNYSRFIRTGAKRIAAYTDNDSSLLVSAYRNTDRTVNVVIVNNTGNDKHVRLDTQKGRLNRLRSYVTDANGNLQPFTVKNDLVIPARAVVTVTGSINQ